MKVGNRWILRNIQTHSPIVISVQPSPTAFGCANLPVPVYIYKIDPRNYWSVNYQSLLHWFLGVKPNYDVIGFGHYWLNFQDELSPDSATAYYRSRDPEPLDNPPYVLLREAAPTTYAVQQSYPSSPTTGDYACYPDDPDAHEGLWSVDWSDASVTTPGYTGSAVKAAYSEESEFGLYLENWYFVPDIGPVRIEAVQQGGVLLGLTLDLVEFEPSQNEPRDPHVDFRDLLICAAGATAGLSFYDWNYFFTEATAMAGPPPEEACLDQSTALEPLTVDQYLLALANRGESCSSITWDFSILHQMEQLANTTSGLNFDQWNYYYEQVTGTPGPAPNDVCMPEVRYVDGVTGQDTIDSPNRHIHYTSKQWFMLFQYQGTPCGGTRPLPS